MLFRSGAPLAPGAHFEALATDPKATPVLARLDPEPIACASLGQVYRGRTREGVEAAVKVQRPEAVRQVALDFAVAVTGLALLQMSGWGRAEGRWGGKEGKGEWRVWKM